MQIYTRWNPGGGEFSTLTMIITTISFTSPMKVRRDIEVRDPKDDVNIIVYHLEDSSEDDSS
jgi:hypothetical protein